MPKLALARPVPTRGGPAARIPSLDLDLAGFGRLRTGGRSASPRPSVPWTRTRPCHIACPVVNTPIFLRFAPKPMRLDELQYVGIADHHQSRHVTSYLSQSRSPTPECRSQRNRKLALLARLTESLDMLDETRVHSLVLPMQIARYVLAQRLQQRVAFVQE